MVFIDFYLVWSSGLAVSYDYILMKSVVLIISNNGIAIAIAAADFEDSCGGYQVFG